MARNTEAVTVPKFQGSQNRDLGKRFLITEWPAARADNWVTRVGFAFNQGAGAIPMDLSSIGWEGIARPHQVRADDSAVRRTPGLR